MSGVNKVILIGNLGTDVELRYTANGSAVSTFRLAVSRVYGTDRKEETEWLTIVAWNKLAEVVAQVLAKGRKVYVEGRLATRTWDGPDGAKRYRTEVVASEVNFLDARPGERAAEGSDVEPDDLPFE